MLNKSITFFAISLLSKSHIQQSMSMLYFFESSKKECSSSAFLKGFHRTDQDIHVTMENESTFVSRRLSSTRSAMGVPSPYMSSAISTTDKGKEIEELGEDIHVTEWVEVEIEEPDLMEVGPNGPTGPNGMDLTTEPSAQPVRDRRRDFSSAANLTIQYLESIGVYDDDDDDDDAQ